MEAKYGLIVSQGRAVPSPLLYRLVGQLGRRKWILLRQLRTLKGVKIKLLIIEDDPQVVQAISTCFEMRWPDSIIRSVSEGREGIELVETELPDVVLLDIGLPDISGFEVLRQIRFFSDVPIIIETVEEQELERVRGLELGADDYLVKPFSYMELLSRVKAVLRRAQGLPVAEERPFVSGRLSINLNRNEVRIDGKPVRLTPTEYKLLCLLVRNRGQVVTQRRLMQQVWGEDYIENTDYLRAYIRRLRAKLQDELPQMILTKHGVGYTFVSSS